MWRLNATRSHATVWEKWKQKICRGTSLLPPTEQLGMSWIPLPWSWHNFPLSGNGRSNGKKMFSYGLRPVTNDGNQDAAKLETCEMEHFFSSSPSRMQSDGNFNLNLPEIRGFWEQKEILRHSEASGILCHFYFWFQHVDPITKWHKNASQVSVSLHTVWKPRRFPHTLAMEFNLLSSASFEFSPRIAFEIIDTNNFKLTPVTWPMMKVLAIIHLFHNCDNEQVDSQSLLCIHV